MVNLNKITKKSWNRPHLTILESFKSFSINISAMPESASIYIGKNPSIQCAYGEKCLRLVCRSIIEPVSEILKHHFPPSKDFLRPEQVSTPHNLEQFGYDGRGNNYVIHQYYRPLTKGVRCDTNIHVNHPDAKKIIEEISKLEIIEELRKKGYTVE